MSKQISKQQAEKLLHDKFYNKMVSFKYPGYDIVYGKVDQICIDHNSEIVIQMNGKRYTCSPESLKECLTLLTKLNGNNSGAEAGDATGIQ